MSEDRNRDYSKYDAMTTEELEEILRLDASVPEGEDSDTELLLYVMGVLANRRKNNGTGKTALEAWESFQQNYLTEEEECLEPTPITRNRSKPCRPWLRRLIAAAAVIALVVCIPLSAKAFGWEKLWDVFARWAKETFSFVSGEDIPISEPSPDDRDAYTSLQELLYENNRDPHLVPTWVPEGFELESLEKAATPAQEIYRAIYLNGDDRLEIRIITHLATDVYNVEIENEIIEVYTAFGIDFYIFQNVDQLRAVWTIDSYECVISGDVSLEEIKMMIDSIGKG